MYEVFFSELIGSTNVFVVINTSGLARARTQGGDTNTGLYVRISDALGYKGG
jgi:hypothetical protein